MTPTAPPSETAPRRRVFRRRAPSPVVGWVAQAALIVFGVVVGLALNEWREDRAEAERTDRVLAALADEIRSNQASVEPIVAYYRDMTRASLAAVEARGPDVSFDMGDVDGYRGDVLPTLTAGTYDAATATGALLGVEIGLASTLSTAYSVQDDFRPALSENMLTRMSRPTPQLAVWRASSIMQSGEALLGSYDAALRRLRAAE